MYKDIIYETPFLKIKDACRVTLLHQLKADA